MPRSTADDQAARSTREARARGTHGRGEERAAALVALGRDPRLAEGDLPGFLQTLTTRAAETLDVARVAVWLFDETRTVARCAAVAERGAPRLAIGDRLRAADHPTYFRTLEDARIVDADDAQRDPRTAEFASTYLGPFHVGAVLDAPVRLRGRVAGVVCHEHAATPRRWSAGEKRFASSLADLVALAMEASERARAEATAREAEQRHRALLEGTSDVFYAVDLEGRIVSLNPAFQRVLGWAPEAWVGRHFAELMHPDDVPAAASLLQRAVSGDAGVQPTELRVHHADGSWRVGEFSVATERRGGAMVGVLGIARDVTARHDEQRRLRGLLAVSRAIASTLELEQALDRVLEAVLDLLPCDAAAAFGGDPSTGGLRLAAQRGLGPTALAELRSTTVPLDALGDAGVRPGEVRIVAAPADAPPAVERAMTAFGFGSLVAVGFGGPRRYAGVLVAAWHAVDAARPMHASLCETVTHQVANGLGTIALYDALERDVRLRRARARLAESLLESLDLAVVADRLSAVVRESLRADSARTWLYRKADDAFEVIGEVGGPYVAEGIIGLVQLPRAAVGRLVARLEREPVVELSADDAETLMPAPLWRVGQNRRMLAIALRHAGELIGLQTVGRRDDRPFDDDDRRILEALAQTAALAIENASLVERLDRADRLRSDLMAAMSHELRTPVNVVVGYGDLVLEGAFGEVTGEVREAVARLTGTARQLGRLVAMALDLSGLDAGRLPIAWTDVDLSELVHEVVAQLRDTTPGTTVPIRIAVDPDVPLRTDREKLRIVLANLVGNALKFTERGSVEIAVAAGEHDTAITVRDTGPGIPSEERDVIFEAFRQGRAARDRPDGGVGLGLHIVRRLVDALGGTVTVDDAAERGAVFQVRLPHRG